MERVDGGAVDAASRVKVSSDLGVEDVDRLRVLEALVELQHGLSDRGDDRRVEPGHQLCCLISVKAEEEGGDSLVTA